MAINKKPKPLRPDTTGTKAEVRGRMSTKPTIKVAPKKPLKKAAVRNPSAPSAAGPRGSEVRIITKSESKMKKDKAYRNRTGIGRPQNASAFKKTDAQSKPIKKSTGNQRFIDDTQQIGKKGYIGLTAAEKKSLMAKGNKPTKVTPKKTAPAPKPKRRLYIGRGGARGGIGGGGDLFGGIK